MVAEIPVVASETGVCGTIKVATWSICCGQKEGLDRACKSLDSLAVDIGFLQETKITCGESYPRESSRYTISATNAPSKHKREVAFCWKEGGQFYEVEEEKKWHANVMTIQVKTAATQYYIVGCYLPWNDITTLAYMKKAWEQYPRGCTPLLIGN